MVQICEKTLCRDLKIDVSTTTTTTTMSSNAISTVETVVTTEPEVKSTTHLHQK